jgi:hypothetical protein
MDKVVWWQNKAQPYWSRLESERHHAAAGTSDEELHKTETLNCAEDEPAECDSRRMSFHYSSTSISTRTLRGTYMSSLNACLQYAMRCVAIQWDPRMCTRLSLCVLYDGISKTRKRIGREIETKRWHALWR